VNVGDVQSRYNAADATGTYFTPPATATAAAAPDNSAIENNPLVQKNPYILGAIQDYQQGNYQGANYLANNYAGLTSDVLSKVVPGFDQSQLAEHGVYLPGFAASGPTGNTNITSQQIQDWLKANPNASDATIANAMDKFGVSTAQMANATGLNLADVKDRFGLATDISSQGTQLGVAPKDNALGSTYDQQWASFMDAHKDPITGQVDPVTVKEMARATGLTEADIQKRYDAAEKALHPVKTDTKTSTTTTGTGTGTGTVITGGTGTSTGTSTGTGTGTVITGGAGTGTGTNTGVTPGGTLLPTATTYVDPATGILKGYGDYGSGNVTGTDANGNVVSIATPGDIITNQDQTRTVVPNIPGRPYGGFTGIDSLVSAYTAGGGHTGYVSPVVKNIADFNAKYDTQTGGSRAAYDYLMGKSPYPITPYTPTGEIAKPYYSSVMGMPANTAYTVSQPLVFDPTTRSYKPNPNFDPHFSATRDYLQAGQVGIAPKTAQMLGYRDLGNGVFGYPNPDGTYTGTDGKAYDANGVLVPVKAAAGGGLMGLAAGGMSNLGSYSDGGRLLKGPGDGISDSIPATIGADGAQPARLADGEFVVPARIVSELGNGSTEAGARRLYQMMDRVQNARKKTIGKNQVAANSRAEKYLPA
jgi:hypothetical protein